jgi:hypothetical protein
MAPRTATFTLFGMLNWTYNWHVRARRVPVAELADQVGRLFLRGYTGSEAAFPSAGTP